MRLRICGRRRRRGRRRTEEEEDEKKKKKKMKHSCPDNLDQRSLPTVDPLTAYAKPHPQYDKLQLGKASGGERCRKVVKPSPSRDSGGAKLKQHPGFEKSPSVNVDTIITINKDKCSEGDNNGESAKAKLFELCAVKKWKSPSFQCCKEDGPSHMRQFTFEAIVEVEDESRVTVLNCFSAPRSKKKAAAEHAAEGALWYLNHQGYFPKK